jgi:nitrous oxidase accessory protein NosD
MATTSSAIDRAAGSDAMRPSGALLANRYRLEALQSGAAGRFAAVDRTTGERVFVKFGARGGRFARQAELLARLDHPGIVRFKDAGTADGRPFVVLEWVDGSDLEAVLAARDHRLGDDQLIRLLDRLAAAVGAVHVAGWLHRDLKPVNILVRSDGTPVIVDFGAAAPIQDAGTAPDSELTDGYAAPEQYLTDGGEGPWTDLYGLGAIAYRALCGRPPVPAPARLHGEAMPLAIESAGRHAEALCRAIDWALALDIKERPQTAEDWSAALGVASEEPGLLAPAAAAPSPLEDYPPTVRVQRAPRTKVAPGSAVQPPAPGSRSRLRGRLVLAAALLLALSAGVAGAAWYGRPLYERYVKSDWIVDPGGTGDALTLSDALARAGAGATIAIRPGTYDESLTLDRAIHLLPAVPEEAPLIAPSKGPCVTATAAAGSIKGLRFAGAKANDPRAVPEPCLLLSNSGLRLEGNRIAGGDGPAVLVQGGGTPTISGNAIEAGAGPGIVVTAGAAPLIAQNTIAGVARSALIVRSGAVPEIIDNTIENSGGVVFAEGAGGILRSNRISASTTSGIEIASGATPSIADTTIEQAAGAGVFVYDHGGGRLERNFIIGSRLSGVVITGGGDVQLSGNAIRESAEHGVVVDEGGRAVLEGNAIADNHGNGIVIGWDAKVEQSGNELSGNAEPQLLDARAP